MSKRVLAVLVVLVIASGLTMVSVAQTKGTWTGIVTDQMCANKGVKLDDAACAAKCVAAGSKYALYNTADKKVYVLNPQTEAAKEAGMTVTVLGSVDGDTITASSIRTSK